MRERDGGEREGRGGEDSAGGHPPLPGHTHIAGLHFDAVIGGKGVVSLLMGGESLRGW